MNPTRTTVVLCLLLSGCGSCQRSGEPPGGSAAPGGPGAKPGAQAPKGKGKIQAAPRQPTVGTREAGAARQPAEGNVPPAGGAPAGGAAGAPEEGGDCIVVADANPDYGPPPLA